MDKARPGQPGLPDTSLRVAYNGLGQILSLQSEAVPARGQVKPHGHSKLDKKGITYRPQLGA